MRTEQAFEQVVLGAIGSLQDPRRADLVTIGELQRRLGAATDRLQRTLRNLETAGLIMCTPTAGPIALVNLTCDAALGSEAIAS